MSGWSRISGNRRQDWQTNGIKSLWIPNVVSYNKETGVYEYSKDRNGRNLDQDNLVTSIMRSVREGDYKSPVEASFSITPPARTQAQAKAQYQVIGTFTTKLTNNKNRNKNVTLAAEGD